MKDEKSIMSVVMAMGLIGSLIYLGSLILSYNLHQKPYAVTRTFETISFLYMYCVIGLIITVITFFPFLRRRWFSGLRSVLNDLWLFCRGDRSFETRYKAGLYFQDQKKKRKKYKEELILIKGSTLFNYL